MDVQPKVVTQPQVTAAQPKTNNWQTDLCDCFSDCGVCLCGMFCFPCLSCQVATAMNECCCCGAGVAMRAVYRTKYNLPCWDSKIFYHWFIGRSLVGALCTCAHTLLTCVCQTCTGTEVFVQAQRQRHSSTTPASLHSP
uniref:Uncharacterized protein n=1 Tax=Naja naja TaxID=35670 RepID=A0A8C6VLW0_NAJNA